MTDNPSRAFSLRERALALHWSILLLATILFVGLLELLHLPAALLLGAMAAGILVSTLEGRIVLPGISYWLAQGIIGCLVARSIDPGILSTMIKQWPVFLFSIAAVIAASSAIGGLLTRWKVLPGTTAVWGSAPGAATTMMIMAEAFGGDTRLVAFMQFLRVIFVAVTASAVSHIWMTHGAGALPAIVWFPDISSASFAATLAVALGGAAAGAWLRIPAGSLLLPMFLGFALQASGAITITLPPWLLAICYAIIGWGIGQRFTRDIVVYAARSFVKVSASILALIATCGGLGYVIHLMTGIDALTAYFATSPGGADSIAIIAASSKIDLPFVMAMQTGRFLVVLLIGPSLARATVRWTARTTKPAS